ncbi:ATP-dependent metallopeptidase FtsH/Yme1/Tma family protein [Clostridium fermenticellae]|uniref:ATP-dependent metallopeptidase FtsH/Yme1/Tma family protein n=1 Tax=Clostridium fermenticellae TaxID=2068654 RepID=A0A386H5U8_9CLOT|nr:ATP-dependent metallopeptidase FtsH/Yme1/Tma family protein [Clostridium fermenticellae]AYD41121.1 ATP-dependent metallopeptidase FtsH/Yme1/Tma family protein [Clostridium fermenticellae]
MKKYKNKLWIIPIVTAILFGATLIFTNFSSRTTNYKPYVSFLEDTSNKKIANVYIGDSSKITIKLKDGKTYQTDNPRTDNFKEDLLKQNINVSEDLPVNLVTLIPSLGLIASIAVLIFMGVKTSAKKSKKAMSVESMEALVAEDSDYTFEDIAGNEEAKESVQDIVDFLKNPEKYSSYGARMPRGVILYGEPGTGKTLLAKAVASEANVPFYAVSGSDFIQVYVGVGASRIRQLFKKARESSNGKAVIFIDEIDAIGKRRDGAKSTGGSDERDQTLNALLTEMSGFKDSQGIVVMAATNRLDMLDPALLRPGRFDRHIEIMLPDRCAREKIIKLHLANKPVGNIDICELAQKTSYFSGAKIENLMNEAAILACKADSKLIEKEHVDKAFSIILAGYEKKNRSYIEDIDKKITAYHEAGHAIVSMKVLPNEKISKITIIPSTKGAGGYTLSIPEDRMYQNKRYLKNRIMVLLGGRAAEEIIFGEEFITTGAHSDLKQSTKIAINMITQYGMGDTLGLLNVDEISNLNLNQDDVLGECKEFVDSIYSDVKKLLILNKDKLEKLSNMLLEKETLNSEDIVL